jgi:hypothetical protein
MADHNWVAADKILIGLLFKEAFENSQSEDQTGGGRMIFVLRQLCHGSFIICTHPKISLGRSSGRGM